MKPCYLCKWRKNAPFDSYCVNPAIPANKIAIAVDGWVNGMSPCGAKANKCETLRAPFGACGLRGNYFEVRTEPEYIMEGKICPEGGNYVAWAKEHIHEYAAWPDTQTMLEEYIKENTQ